MNTSLKKCNRKFRRCVSGTVTMIYHRGALYLLIVLLLLSILASAFRFLSTATPNEFDPRIRPTLETERAAIITETASDSDIVKDPGISCRHNSMRRSNSTVPGLHPWRASIGECDSAEYKDYGMKCPGVGSAGLPFLFKNYRTGRKAIFCLTPKTGSTTWKQLLGEGMGLNIKGMMVKRNPITVKPEARKELSFLIGTPATKITVSSSCDETRDALADPSVKRFILVRNPYARFLSGYLDKVEQTRVPRKKFLPTGYINGEGFSRFANAYLRMKRNAKRINPHFAPTSSLCNIRQGMKYDYILDVEEMHKWYEPLINYLEIVREAQFGWNIHTKYFDGSKSCFYTPPGKTCDGLFVGNEIHNDKNSSKPSGRSNNGGSAVMPRSFHATGSSNKLDQYYDNDTIALVTEFAKNDFQIFKYPKWVNMNGAEYSKYLNALHEPDER